jgi:hypothetical protein
MKSSRLGERRGRLRLHRETVRTLSEDDLGRAAGGYTLGTIYNTINPKTTAWSSNIDAACGL